MKTRRAIGKNTFTGFFYEAHEKLSPQDKPHRPTGQNFSARKNPLCNREKYFHRIYFAKRTKSFSLKD